MTGHARVVFYIWCVLFRRENGLLLQENHSVLHYNNSNFFTCMCAFYFSKAWCVVFQRQYGVLNISVKYCRQKYDVF